MMVYGQMVYWDGTITCECKNIRDLMFQRFMRHTNITCAKIEPITDVRDHTNITIVSIAMPSNTITDNDETHNQNLKVKIPQN